MTKDIRIAGFQMAVGQNIEENARRICEAIDWSAENGAEIMLTPEGSLSGYIHAIDQSEVGEALKQVTAKARNRNVGLALGTCFIEEDGNCYNQIRFYQPNGNYLGYHSKILCCGSVGVESKGEVNYYAVSELRTFRWRGELLIGGLICNDMWANPECTSMRDPHLSQQLSVDGCQIILHAVNGGRSGNEWSKLTWQFHEANLRMRARAGKLWIVTVDNANPVEFPTSAFSGVIDPSGQFVCRSESKGEQLFAYTIEVNDSQ